MRAADGMFKKSKGCKDPCEWVIVEIKYAVFLRKLSRQ